MGTVKKLRSSPPSSSSSVDLNHKLTLCDIFVDSISKHRTCWLHIAAHHYHCNSHITWEEVKKIRQTYRGSSPCFSRAISHRQRIFHERSAKMSNGENSHLMDSCAAITPKEGNKLDTDTFECYMESIWKNNPENKRMSFAYLDSLWFSMYREQSTRPKVLTWIKQKCIFSKKYVFVPIVCWGHWSLLILVHLGESPHSESRTPCMLLLDSLENADARRLEPEIRKFVVDIYEAEGRTENKKEIAQIPLLLPKVPQQRDDEECGCYVLYFIKLFMESAPDDFSINDGYPYFMLQKWFNPEDLDSFRDKLEKELPRKKPAETKVGRITRHRPRRKGVTTSTISVDD